MDVLLGIGGSVDSMRALDRTVRRSRVAGDRLTVAVLEEAESDREPATLVEATRERLEEHGVDGEIRRVSGDPGSRLVEIAESEGFDELVLGGGITSPMGKIELGPIAEFVLLNSHVTVTLVR